MVEAIEINMNEDSNKQMIGFHMANKAAMHLGRKLYSTTPPALAELIANSYDAYASEVFLELDAERDRIVVADNGIGMSYDGLTNRYAIIGNTKVPDEAPDGFMTRKPMGKKGIGKLASFSLGNDYEVWTRENSANLWRNFAVNYYDYINEDNRDIYQVPSRLVKLPDRLSSYRDFDHGFIIEVKILRRKILPQTLKGIQSQLSRRFYIKSSSDSFTLYLNGEPIDLSLNIYYRSLEFVTYFGYEKAELQDLLDPEDKNNIEFVEYPHNKGNADNQELFKKLLSNQVHGWIGTVGQPKQLKGDSNNSNIVVYINKKIADEDVLKNEPNSTLANEYIVGEFFADYLGEGDDPITSSRQGLDHDDPKVQDLIKMISKIRSYVIEQWGERREHYAIKRMPKWLQENHSYKTWEEGLNPSQQKLNSKLLKAVSVQLDRNELDDERACAMVNSIIDVVTNEDIYRLADELEKITEDNFEVRLASVAELLSRIASSERLKQAQIVSERLAAIKKLEDLMADPTTLERTFEEHLFDNPWLINPYWNQSYKSQSEIDIIRQKFHKLYDEKDETYKRTFIDIYIEVAEEQYPIVIELKRNTAEGYAKVTASSIQEQIEKYRQAIIQSLGIDAPSMDKPSVIKAYFILSENAGLSGQNHPITFNQDDMATFKIRNIEVLQYSQLVHRAKQAYREHMKVLEDSEQIPFLRLEK